MIEPLPQDVRLLQELLVEQRKQNQALLEKITVLAAQLEKLQRLLFGQKSERHIAQPPTTSAIETSVSSKLISVDVTSSHKTLNGRRKLPEELVRVSIKHDIAEDKQYCPTCQCRIYGIGEEVTEQLDFMRVKLYVKKHIRYKYACRCCQSKVLLAPLPPQPIDKGLAGSGLLAEILVNKYEDALPLYRQEQRWKRLGYALTRSTLCDWVMQCAQRLKPIVDAMIPALLMRSPKIHTDDTIAPVLAKVKTHKSRLWVYIGGGGGSLPCVIYQYSPTRSQAVPGKFLADYQGFLQADAYAGYDRCYSSGSIIEVACWAHARRKFVDALPMLEIATLADEALAYIRQLYALENRAKLMTDNQRYYFRRRYAKPLLKQFYRWLTKQLRLSPPKSPLAQAMQYCLNHWQALNNYLRAGYLAIDNNAAERAIKPVVIGRKNYLFAGSHKGAESAAVIYSLINTCKLLGVNTFDYLKDVLERLPTTLMKNISDLFPHHWKPVVTSSA